MPKFTFKKEPRETGLRAVGHPYADTNIKLDRKVVGTIVAPCWSTKDRKWAIHLMVKSESNPNCDWGWIGIKQKFDTEPEARQWIKDNAEKLLNHNLHQQEDD